MVKLERKVVKMRGMFCIASRDNTFSLKDIVLLTGALGFVRRATRLVLPTPESPSMTILYRGGLAVVDVALFDMVALR